jgi:KpsF/GutQ family protein
MKREEILETAQYVWRTGADELQRLCHSMDPDALERCVHMLAECKGRIITAGVGTSGVAAKKIAHTLSCIERPAFFLDPGDSVHGAIGAAQPGDVAILISKGGGTREIINMIDALEAKEVTIIGVTENPDSMLGRHSDLIVCVKVEKEADIFNMLATTSTMAVVAVFDGICIALMKHTGYTKEQFAVIHPGGAVGDRLLGK